MSYIIETTDIDLGDTPIENIFINDFMPMADGTYVKVYLLGYKYANDKDENISVNNQTIAKHLNIPLTDVLSAWDFWESKGIIKKLPKEKENEYDYTVKFLSLKQLLIRNNFQNSTVTNKDESYNNPFICSPEELVEAKKNPHINNMFNEIRKVLSRYITPNEYKRIYEWMTNYNMSPDMIVRAFQYSVQNKNKRTLSYIEGIIKNWYDSDVTNIESLQEYYKSKDEKYYRYERIMKSLGFKNRYITEGEMKVIDKWFEDWGFSIEVILKACENTKNISNPNVNYIDKILESWHKKGISNVKDIDKKDNYNEKSDYTPKSIKNSSSKKIQTKFHNFEQRTSKYTAEDLEKVAKNIRKKRTNR